MKEFTDSLYTDVCESLRSFVNGYNSYMLKQRTTRAMGTKHKDMVLYDFVLLYLTTLLAITYDLLISMYISGEAIDDIMKYMP